MIDSTRPTRRHLLGLGAIAVSGLALSKPAPAMADVSKGAVQYRDIPNNGQVCGQCVYFVFKPSTSAGPQSQCRLVAGNINPAGWCVLWAPKA